MCFQTFSCQCTSVYHWITYWTFVRQHYGEGCRAAGTLLRRASLVVGTGLYFMVTVTERRTVTKLMSALNNANHMLHNSGYSSCQGSNTVS